MSAIALAVALVTQAPQPARKVPFRSATAIAVYAGKFYGHCYGATGNCPYKCGASGTFDLFAILKPTKGWVKPGERFWQGEVFMEFVGLARRIDKRTARTIAGLKPGAIVQFSNTLYEMHSVTKGIAMEFYKDVFQVDPLSVSEAKKRLSSAPSDLKIGTNRAICITADGFGQPSVSIDTVVAKKWRDKVKPQLGL